MRRMRRFTTEKTPTKPESAAPREPANGREYIDEETGLRYKSGVGIDTMLKPVVGKKSTDYGNTVDSILTHAHYRWTSGWENPDAPAPGQLCGPTYVKGVKAGFRGSMSDWHTNVLAGRLVRGKVDLTPRKVEKKVDPPPDEEEEQDRVPSRIRLR